MIPLSNWLRGMDHAPPLAMAAGAPAAAAVPPEPQAAHKADVSEAYERGKKDGARDEGRAWAERLAALQADHEAQLAALRAEADHHRAMGVAESVVHGVAELRQGVENAVSEALRPFLEEAIAAKATTELLSLLDADLSQQADPPLEIRAPAVLHEALRRRMAERDLACALTAADEIRVVLAQGIRRYEVMAERWIGMLRGNPP